MARQHQLVLGLKGRYEALGMAPVIAAVPQWSQPAPAQAPPPVWAATHLAPAEGLPAWAAPDPSQPPIVTLAGRLELVIAERACDWAQVVAINGWTGWVDGRRLVSRG